MDTLHEDLCTFVTLSYWIPPRMRNFADIFVEKKKTQTFDVQKEFFSRT